MANSSKASEYKNSFIYSQLPKQTSSKSRQAEQIRTVDSKKGVDE